MKHYLLDLVGGEFVGWSTASWVPCVGVLRLLLICPMWTFFDDIMSLLSRLQSSQIPDESTVRFVISLLGLHFGPCQPSITRVLPCRKLLPKKVTQVIQFIGKCQGKH